MKDDKALSTDGTKELDTVAAYDTADLMLVVNKTTGEPEKVTVANFLANYGVATDAEITAALANMVYSVSSVVTLAELNAGKILIPAVTGKKIHVVGFAARCGAGNMAAATSFDIADDNGTAVPIQSIAVAAATANAYLVDGTTNVTRGAGYFGDCTVSKNVIIKTVGDAATTGASITVDLLYKLV